MREALFTTLVSWLGSADRPSDEQLTGVGFCDLYGGSGAVGLEAASRGAAPVLIVDHDALTARTAQANAKAAGLTAQVRTARAETMLRTAPATAFDIVFLDPPYDVPSERVSEVVRLVVEHGWLREDGLVVVERSSRSSDLEWPRRLNDQWTRRYGETTLHLASAADAEEGTA